MGCDGSLSGHGTVVEVGLAMSDAKPVMTIKADGAFEWKLNGQFHREDGPAMEWAMAKEWYLNGQRHRTDGPALEWRDGEGNCWYINGREFTFDEWLSRVAATEEERLELIMRWG